MARSRPDDETGEPKTKSDVYVGMLAVTALCMAVGVVVLALESNAYDWESQPKAVAPAPLPTMPPPRGG